jgi:hypothetical protein
MSMDTGTRTFCLPTRTVPCLRAAMPERGIRRTSGPGPLSIAKPGVLQQHGAAELEQDSRRSPYRLTFYCGWRR